MADVSHLVDLDAYFARIGYAGERVPTLAVLRAIHLGHVQAIPYENLDLHLGRRLRLDLPSIEAKLVGARRGGYCFEHNLLFAAVLRALGFAVTLLAARVRWLRAPEEATPLTHGILKVEVEGRSWLADVGFGSVSLTGPLALDVAGEQATPHEPRRLIERGGLRVHQVKLGEAWADAYAFSEEPQTVADWVLYNWYTECHPASRFVQGLVAARAFAGYRVTLVGFEFTKRLPDGSAEKRTLGSEVERLAVLAEVFGIALPGDAVFRRPVTADWVV